MWHFMDRKMSMCVIMSMLYENNTGETEKKPNNVEESYNCFQK